VDAVHHFIFASAKSDFLSVLDFIHDVFSFSGL